MVISVVAGIDPHKYSGTVAVLSMAGVLLACESFDISADGLTRLLLVLSETGTRVERIGVEGSSGLGLPVVNALRAAGYDVREVQASRTNDRRRRRTRAKTDITDAQAIAAETLADPGLPPARKHTHRPSPAWETLHVLRAQRESLVLQRVRLLTEAEPVLCSLPVEVRDQLPSTSRVSAALVKLSTMDTTAMARADQARTQWLAATLGSINTITADIKRIDKQIPGLLAELGCTLTEIVGIGVVTAMTLLTEVGDPTRFATEAQFARWCGAAPVPVSSGEGHGQPRHHRLDLAGNRQVNSVLHIVHVTQARMHEPARAFMTKSTTAGKTLRAARRSHKRQLANVIIRHMWNDAKVTRDVPLSTAA
ncbi:MAG: IS110 family transposase [Propionibacterium sp.]|jgi:transposase|nr:IS110 family transposase [Propionibacterium sp.]